MSNSLFNSLGGGNANNSMQMLNQLVSNPMQFLAQRKYNIPQDIQSDPNAIIQHLMNTGQVSQEQYNRANQMVMKFRK